MGDAALQTVLRQQARSNQNALKYDALFADHRSHLTAAVTAAGPAGGAGRLALLGAGACLDLDLAEVANAYREIHLVDLDRAAIDGARARQASVQGQISCHGPVDLSGVISELDHWMKESPTLSALDALVPTAADRISAALPGPFDVTVSCCLATQLSLGLTSVLGQQSLFLPDLRKRVLTIHLRSLAQLTVPGGTALFVSDVCSNDRYPLDDLPAGSDLAEVLATLSRTGNVFFGSDPLLVRQVLRKDAVLAARFAAPRSLAPWLWRTSPSRVFLVYGLVLKTH